MEGHKREKCQEEKDLGILVSDDLKVGTQCKQAFPKASGMLGILKRNIVNKTPMVMVNLYKTLIRPHVEYCISAWSPYYVKDKKTLDRAYSASIYQADSRFTESVMRNALKGWDSGHSKSEETVPT